MIIEASKRSHRFSALTSFAFLTVVSLVVSCGAAKRAGDVPGTDSDKEPKTSQNQENQQDLGSSLSIRYTDLPAGEMSVLDSSSRIIGTDSLSCSKNGYGQAIFKSKSFGSQQVRVCCVNTDIANLTHSSAKFVTRDGGLYTIKPSACDVVSITGGRDAPTGVIFDLAEQQLAILNSETALADIGNLTLKGAENKTAVLVNGGKDSVKVQGKFDGENLAFRSLGLDYTYTSEADSIRLVKTTFNESSLSLKDTTVNLSGNRKTIFENVKVFTRPDKSPLTLVNYPFNTDGIEIVPHANMQSHVVFRGELSAPASLLKQSYPVVLRNVELSKGAILTVAAGSTLWSHNDSSFSTPMFEMNTDSQIFLDGKVDSRIRLEPFRRLDGGATIYQQFSYSSSSGYKIRLSHVDIDSVKLSIGRKGLLELDEVTGVMDPASSTNPMVSKGNKVSGTSLISLNEGHLKLLSRSTLKRIGSNSFFSYSDCGTIEGLDHLVVDDAAGLTLPSVILLAEENDYFIANDCTNVFSDAGKKQVLHHPSVAVASGANEFRAANSCYLKRYSGTRRSKFFQIDCHSVTSPLFENISLVSEGITYWTGTVTDEIEVILGDKWFGPTNADGRIILRAPDGREFFSFDEGVDVELMIPENEYRNGFTLKAVHIKD